MGAVAGAWCTGSEVRFRFTDPDRRLSGVRLRSGVLPAADFAYRDRAWELRLPRPAVQRVEYRLELSHPDGRSEETCDPGNPLRAPGGYGDSSVVHCDTYREPEWLGLPAAAGDRREVRLPLPAVRGEVVARVWSPRTPTDRMVVAHDGPDFDRYGALGHYSAALIGAGRVPPYHLVLLPAPDRFEWYSASPAYARALTGDALPALGAVLGTERPVVGVGASLGALAMLHAQRRHPERFAGLFLQSGSFFQPRYDRQESGFPCYLRIVRFTGRVLRNPGRAALPVTMTCGTVEENLANNRDMARALGAVFAEVPDAHTWTGWRDALDPHLTELLQKVF